MKLLMKKAKENLERKFGGKRRIMNTFLDEIEQYPSIRYESAKNIEQFADLLDVAIVNKRNKC
jgi:hypothetical protein